MRTNCPGPSRNSTAGEVPELISHDQKTQSRRPPDYVCGLTDYNVKLKRLV